MTGKVEWLWGNRKGKRMTRIHNMASYVLAATLALTALVGCKKGEPSPTGDRDYNEREL
jgi:hypothetical protein